MKRKILLLLISLNINANAQDNFLRDFVDNMASEVIPKDFHYYNLVDSSFIMKLDKYDFNKIDDADFLKSYPDFPIELAQKVIDSTIIDWRKIELKNAKCYNYDSLPRRLSGMVRISKIADLKLNQIQIDSLNSKISSSELYVKFKPHWNDKRRKKESDKAWKRNDSLISKENRIYYKFSTPQFSADKIYAIITIKRHSSGSTLIFKKTESGWKKIYEFNRWIG